MRNPLWKRLPKELKEEAGKYLVIFLYMVITIGLTSGLLVAGDSMSRTYDESFEKYNIEHGHFAVSDELTDDMKDAIEDSGVTLYDMQYFELDCSAGDGGTLRVFRNRTDVNKICMMEGELPSADDEIAIDRLYAQNNGLKVGDSVEAADKTYRIAGFVALSEYSTMFQNNSDTMFDATIFGVAVVTDSEFDRLSGCERTVWSYSWKYDDGIPDDESDEKELADDLMETVYTQAVMNGMTIKLFIPRYANQAVNFAGEDMSGDTVATQWFEYIGIVIMGFIFAVTTNNTLVKEASTIGTLRASGYTRRELLIHYISLPIIVTFVAAIVGNILGYTYFKDWLAAIYYNSYSLTKYVTYWNAEAFVLSTVVPIIIMLVVNLWMVGRKLRLSPLKFIRHDLSTSKRKKAVKLPHWKFFTRFRTRVILQNIPGYIIMFVGVFFAQVLLMFGLIMAPLLNHFEDEILTHLIAENQYVLDSPVSTSSKDAEEYCMGTLEMDDGDISDEISIYGIQEGSRYFDADIKDGDVLISDSYADKYDLETGATIELCDEYGDDKYEFTVSGIYTYPSSLAVFMTESDYRDTFDKDDDYFTGYFSDSEITDIDEHVVTEITKDDLIKVSRQLMKSMGDMFWMISALALVMFALLIYLLTKLIIERNTVSISMVKILGYDRREINRLYLTSTTIVVVAISLVGVILGKYAILTVYRAMMKEMISGWLPLYTAPWICPVSFGLCVAVYLLVSLLLVRRIKNIPMDEALKNVE